MGLDTMILVFWMLSFKPAFSLSSFTFIKRLFSSSSLSAIRVVSSAYLRWLIFLPAILIPAFASSSSAFHMMYTAYKLINSLDVLLSWFGTRSNKCKNKTRRWLWLGSWAPYCKIQLKLKKVGKTTRPFRYDLSQIPDDYTVEVRNRFKGLDLIDRVPD